MAKAPSIQFYPGDWQRDTGLKMCSLAARGLWAEMMWLMFDGEPYGHLSVKGSDIPPDKLAVIVGVPLSVVEALLAELEKYGVFSRTPHGVIYSRRMVNDWNRRQTNAANGSKGGNPRLSKSVNRKDKGKDIPLTADAVADSSTVLNSSEKERASAKPDLQDRIDGFRELCLERNDGRLSQVELEKFIAYWTEHNEGARKFRAELQEVFQVERRMDTWANNAKSRTTAPADRHKSTIAPRNAPIPNTLIPLKKSQ